MKNIDRDITRAHYAEELQKNPLLNEIFSEIEKEIFTAWQLSKANEPEKREEAWRLNAAISLIRTKLQTAVNNGKIAEMELAKLEKPSPSN